VDEFRKMLVGVEIDKEEFVEIDDFGRPVIKDSHQELLAQKEKNERLKQAFGLRDDFVDGSSFARNRDAKTEDIKVYKQVCAFIST